MTSDRLFGTKADQVVVDEIALHDKKGAAPADQAAAPEPEAEYLPYDIPF